MKKHSIVSHIWVPLDIYFELTEESMSFQHLGTTLQDVRLKLTEEEIKYLEEAYQPVKVLGHM